MKARQIAPAPTSVYTIGEQDQIRWIERGLDGLWGRWQEEGGGAKRIVHGGSIVAKIGLDEHVSALQRRPRTPWFTWDRRATELCAAHIPERGPMLFATDRDIVWHAWKEAPS